MGLPDSILVRYKIQGGGPTSPNYNIIFPYYGFYLNDVFRVSPKLTISAGLRYDLNIPDYTPDRSSHHAAPFTAQCGRRCVGISGHRTRIVEPYLSAPKTDLPLG